jgi:biopolymer transport protein ExbB
MFEFFLKGGPLMWLLLLCSVVSLAIILERIYYFYSNRSRLHNIATRVKKSLQENKPDAALKLCEQVKGPLAHILAIGIHIRGRSIDEKEKLVSRAGSRVLRNFDRNLRGLAIIGKIAPLIGLLGTVMGMIKAFIKIQEAGGRVEPAVLAGGIWQALITTAFGLAIAIPTLVAYHYFESHIDNISSQLKDAATEIIEL